MPPVLRQLQRKAGKEIHRPRSRMRPPSLQMIRMAARACLKPALHPPPWSRIQLPAPSILMRLPQAMALLRFRKAAQALPQAGPNLAPASGRSTGTACLPCGPWGTASPASWRAGGTATTTTPPGIPGETPSSRQLSSPACPRRHAEACSTIVRIFPPWTCRGSIRRT